jgi:deoxyribodipyrimidine photolyase
MRAVYQSTMERYQTATNKRALSNFISRLHWHCHFIQKFEDECTMEFLPVNRAYDAMIKPRNEVHIIAWQSGQTGVPIIDACMRCLVATGYINFRMRAMVVSFFVLIYGKIGEIYTSWLGSFWIMSQAFTIPKYTCSQASQVSTPSEFTIQ